MVCQLSNPLNSENASPFGTLRVYLSWADISAPVAKTASATAEIITIPDEIFAMAHSFDVICKSRAASLRSAEGEVKDLHARVKKIYLEIMICDGLRLTDQLVGSRFGDSAGAHFVDISTVGDARRLPVDCHAKSHRGPWYTRRHDKVQIAGVEAIHDSPLDLVQHRGLWLDGPIAP